MSRIKPVLETTHDGVRRSFDAIERQLGVVPNMMRTMAQSPRVLEGYLALSEALSRGLLPATLREQIALAVAEANACNYCLSAHAALGRVRAAGFSDAEVAEIIADVALNVLTNYFNRAADTEIDFPKVAAAQLVQERTR